MQGRIQSIQAVGLMVSSLSIVGMLIGEHTRDSRRKWDLRSVTGEVFEDLVER